LTDWSVYFCGAIDVPRPDVSEARTNQILDAAAAVFARLGFHQARMDDIVAEAGLSKGALYWYFTSKDAIITALLERVFAHSLHDLDMPREAEGSVSARLPRLTERIVAELQRLAHLQPIAFEFYAVAARHKTVRQFLKEYFARYRAALAALVQQGIDRGEFRALDADATALAIVAVYEGLALLWAVDPGAARWDAQAETAMRLLLEGLHIGARPHD
jgi:AcrR family transcriptional regulator